jgi:DNA-binding helix-hairpin-helix protein with protein kinase domain
MSTLPKLINSSDRPLQLEKELARGGEGVVYTLRDDPASVAKFYLKPPSQETIDKLQAMVTLAPRKLMDVSAWPTAVLRDASTRKVAGFLMPRLNDYLPVQRLYNPAMRLEHFPRAGWAFQVRAARNLAAAFDEAHRAGCIVGDVNHSNAFVSQQAVVRLIDCDSFQVRANGRIFHTGVGTPEFVAPELQGRPYGNAARTPNHDHFGLALLIHHLLMVGRHPYSGIYTGRGEPELPEQIKNYRFAYGPQSQSWDMAPPPYTPRLNDLPPEIGSYFRRAFERGSEQGNRPTATEWMSALDRLEKSVAKCSTDAGHTYWNGAKGCVWCRLAENNDPQYYDGVVLCSGSFEVDEERLRLVLKRLAELETIPVYRRENFHPTQQPTPRPLPLTPQQVDLLRRVILPFDESPPPESIYPECPPFTESPPEPDSPQHEPFSEPTPARPKGLVLESFREPEPMKPKPMVLLPFSEPAPVKPNRRVPKELPKPEKPTPPKPFNERSALRSLDPVEVQNFVILRWTLTALACAGFAAIPFGFAHWLFGLIAAVLGTAFLVWLLWHLRQDPERLHLEDEREKWLEAEEEYRREVTAWPKTLQTWEEETARRRQKCDEENARAAIVYQEELTTWQTGRDRNRQEQIDRYRAGVESWNRTMTDWQKRRDVWNTKKMEEYRGRPEVEEWLRQTAAWEQRQHVHFKKQEQLDQQRLKDWMSQLASWETAERNHRHRHEERIRQLRASWNLQLEDWTRRRQRHENLLSQQETAQLTVNKERNNRQTALTEQLRELKSTEQSYEAKRQDFLVARKAVADGIHAAVAECRTLTTSYSRDFATLQQTSRESALFRHLRLQPIADEYIAGIGPGRKQTLASHGINTAADLTESRLFGISGFGPVLIGTLMQWRRTAEAKFRFDPKRDLDTRQKITLDTGYRNHQRKILEVLEAGLSQLQRLAMTHSAELTMLEKKLRRCVADWRQADMDLSVF